MDPLSFVSRGVAAGLRLGRGTADRVVRVAGPALARVAGQVGARGRRAEPPSPPATFTPSKAPSNASAGTDRPPVAKVPTPATVARNIGAPRPMAEPTRKRTTRKQVPGAKLPPPRPSTP